MSASTSFLTADLAQRLQARLIGAGDVAITGLAAVDQAASGDLTFISDKKYIERWPESKAAAAVVSDGVQVIADHRPLLMVKDAEQAMIPLLALFMPPEYLPPIGVHSSASIDAGVTLGANVRIGPHVSIGANSRIGDNVTVHAGARLYAGVSIGEGTVIHANTVIRDRCEIGRRVILHQNVSIGADGFGYRPSPDGRGLLKMPHIGKVVIEDDVEIGSNSCVDRAKFGVTRIGAGTKIDNLCQIGHNVRIGRSCVIAGCTAIGGSAVLGDGCMLGGQSAIADHVTVGSNVKLAACSALHRDAASNSVLAGTPADDARIARRQWAAMCRLPEVLAQMSHLTGKKPHVSADSGP